MTRETIRVLVVDDSPLAREVIAQVLSLDPAIEVVGVAADGRAAVQMAATLRPSLVSMDIYMPEMDGLAAIQEIMASSACPILVVTSDKNSKLAYRALQCGALDVVEKPQLFEEARAELYAELIDRVKLLSKVKVITHVRGRKVAWSDAYPPLKDETPAAPFVVGIGASTGGPSAIARILGQLEGCRGGIVIVQHLSEGFTQGLVQWLDEVSPLKVKEAMHGDLIEPGTAYIAPADQHAEVATGERIHLSQRPLVNGHRPSADVLFQSMARTQGVRGVGVILTGMGADGAEGLLTLRAAGGRTIAQNEESCLIFGMPRVAVEIGAAERVLPLDEIAPALRALTRS